MQKQPTDYLRSLKKPVTRTLRLISDQTAADELDNARQDLKQLNMMAYNRTDEGFLAELAKARSRLADSELAVKECTSVWKFKSIGTKAYGDMKKAHPPTDENRREMAAEGGDPDSVQFNTSTFPAALISASLVEPQLSPEDVKTLMDEEYLNEGEVMELFNAAMMVNIQRRIGELGNF
jgi:hypothetical protein